MELCSCNVLYQLVRASCFSPLCNCHMKVSGWCSMPLISKISFPLCLQDSELHSGIYPCTNQREHVEHHDGFRSTFIISSIFVFHWRSAAGRTLYCDRTAGLIFCQHITTNVASNSVIAHRGSRSQTIRLHLSVFMVADSPLVLIRPAASSLTCSCTSFPIPSWVNIKIQVSTL